MSVFIYVFIQLSRLLGSKNFEFVHCVSVTALNYNISLLLREIDAVKIKTNLVEFVTSRLDLLFQTERIKHHTQ